MGVEVVADGVNPWVVGVTVADGLSLKTVNYKTGTDRNAAALKAILERFPEIDGRLREEARRAGR